MTAAAHAPTTGPYVASLTSYTKAGWRGVLPIPAGAKWPPPDGHTGHQGDDPDGPTLFFPGHAESPRQAAARTARAKQLCMSCPHRDRCRELAGPVDERGVSRYSGIWAGEVRLNIDDVRRTRRDAKRRKAS